MGHTGMKEGRKGRREEGRKEERNAQISVKNHREDRKNRLNIKMKYIEICFENVNFSKWTQYHYALTQQVVSLG